MSRSVLVCDVETDGFLDQMTRIWTIQIGSVDGDDVEVYADQPGYAPLEEGVARLRGADLVIGHNFQKFDIFAIEKVYPGTLNPRKVWDTMVAARMLFPDAKGHRLEDWGKRLKCAKGEYQGDFSRFDAELVRYAKQDIVVTRALYHHLISACGDWDWSRSFELEFLFQYCMALQERNGFLLDVKLAASLEAELRQRLSELRRDLELAFPARFVPANGTASRSLVQNRRKPDRRSPAIPMPYTRIKLEEFNPGSRQLAVRRLKEKYGWEPWKKTELGTPTLDEQTLGEVDFPEARLLLRYLQAEKQLGQIVNKKGDKGWLIYVDKDTHRVHGAVNPQGTDTGRCSHFKPNMAQVSKKDRRMRECWKPRPGWKLVGCDADGLEFACLAHYVFPLDGGETTERHLSGDKTLGTDVHSVNRDALVSALKRATGLVLTLSEDVLKALREDAKTFLYAFMYGSSDPGLGMTVIEMCKRIGIKPPAGPGPLGTLGRKAVGQGIKGLDKLIEDVKRKAKKQGWLKGIDGRRIRVRSEHSAFNYLLQGAGAIAMKLALVVFMFERAPGHGWTHGVDFALCANVHDEVQIECRPEIAEALGKEMADCIREAGARLGFRCPLSGSYDIGDSWAETH